MLRSQPQGIQVPAVTNYFSMKLNGHIFKYLIEVEPKIPENKQFMLRDIIRKNDVVQGIKEKLNAYQFLNYSLYSPNFCESEFTINTTNDDVETQIKISHGTPLEKNEREAFNILGNYFKNIQRKTKMTQIGRKVFNPEGERSFPDHQVKIWPGFSTSLNKFNKDFLVNIDMTFKVLRTETVLDLINELGRQGIRHEEMNDRLKGSTVLTG